MMFRRTNVFWLMGVVGAAALGAMATMDGAEVAGASGEAANVLRTWTSNARMLESKAPEGCPEWTESATSCQPAVSDPPRPPRIPLAGTVLDSALEGCAEAGGVKIEAQASWIRVPECGMAWNARAVVPPSPAPIYQDNPQPGGPPIALDPETCLRPGEAENLKLFLLPPPDPEGNPEDGHIAGVADFKLSCCEDCGK
jgi:hypothetical protein